MGEEREGVQSKVNLRPPELRAARWEGRRVRGECRKGRGGEGRLEQGREGDKKGEV